VNDLEYVDLILVVEIPCDETEYLKIRITQDEEMSKIWTERILPQIQKIEATLGANQSWSFNGNLAKVLKY